MRRTLKSLWAGTRWCGGCAFDCALWSGWIVLTLLLSVQIYIATHHELEVPAFLLRSLEERLVASGVRATFGRTSFDPTGRVLIENVRVSLPAFAEPILSARTIYVRLDPWALAIGKFDPRELRVSGASLAVPAMLSPSGRSEEILRDLDTTLVPHDHELEIAQLSGRIAGISLVVQGAVFIPPRDPRNEDPLPIAEFLSHNYPAIARQLVAVTQQLTVLDQPAVQLVLSPSPSRVAIANVTLFARSLKLSVPQPIQVTGIHVVTKVPLLGDAPVAARLELTADSVDLPFDAHARRIRAVVRGTVRPGRLQFLPGEFDLTAGSLHASGFSAEAVSVHLVPGPLPLLTADVNARILGAPLNLQIATDLATQTARLRFDGAISTALLTPLSERLHVDVRKYFDFATMDRASGEAKIGPGWKFENLTARVALRGINAYHVPIEEGRVAFTFDGRHFFASEIWARIGENFAHGTFEQDLVTFRYRFLLEGRLRPLDISGWFREWWPNFFHQFEFPHGPPTASVEVSGRWTETRLSTVFAFAEASRPVIRGAALDRVRTRLFIRPGYYDGLEAFVTHPTGSAQGTFAYSTHLTSFAWRTLDLDLVSTLEPNVAVQIIGPVADSVVAPFKWSTPPALKVTGRINGPAAPGGPHTTLHLEARTAGEFRFHDFPVENVVFTADLHDNDIDLPHLEARFAEGTLSGKAKVLGAGADRRVSFNYTLKDASLVRATAALQDYTSRKNNLPPTPPGKFIKEKAAVRLDVTASAEGRYDDPFSYHGEGLANLHGAGLGEVQLLGLLSELFTFTALRFNNARAVFKIDGAKLAFSEVSLRGANSAIDAHGHFSLDRRELDFKAKLFPFQESNNLIKNVVGAVLTPFSNIFEVKLTGSIDKPEWGFVVGPTNFLRALAPGETATGPAKPVTTPAATILPPAIPAIANPVSSPTPTPPTLPSPSAAPAPAPVNP